jgi:hypothetical protein
MYKLYDCSVNNHFKEKFPKHFLNRETKLFKDLKIEANKYGFQFVADFRKCDIMITNTCFTPDALNYARNHKLKMINRIIIDSWKNPYIQNTTNYSDLTIFTDEFNKKKLIETGIHPKKDCIIYENINENDIVVKNQMRGGVFIAYSSNWSKENIKLLSNFSKKLEQYHDTIYLIGKCDYDVPYTINNIGVPQDRREWLEILSKGKSILLLDENENNLQFILQSKRLKLPFLYVKSGLLNEYIGDCGIGINKQFLNDQELEYNYQDFRDSHSKLKENINIKPYQETIKEFYSNIKKVISHL